MNKSSKKIESMTEEEKANVQHVCMFTLFPAAIMRRSGNWLFAVICLAVVVYAAFVVDATGEEESD